MGGHWAEAQLQRMVRRLRPNHPPASLRLDVARARIQALWKQHPELTGKQVIVSLGFRHQHLVGIYRATQLLKECRLAAAKRSPSVFEFLARGPVGQGTPAFRAVTVGNVFTSWVLLIEDTF